MSEPPAPPARKPSRAWVIGRRILITVCVLAIVITGGIFAGSAIWASRDDAKAAMTTTGPYTATVESLNKHPLPQWFQDAKFGIMLHWGLYSVPGFAPKGKTFAELLATEYGHAMTHNPYAEDYANAMKDGASPTAAYHRQQFGAMAYEDFVNAFNDGLTEWNPASWAQSFKEAGASYVVLTAKYADGYPMWPTAVNNPHAPSFHATRDLVGELAAAARSQGLKFGVYYSGGIDWTFQPAVVKTLGDYAYLPYGEDYRAYALAQMQELIARYKPDLLWNDISWPTGEKRLYSLIADYYNTVPEGVVNDRWQQATFTRQLMGLAPARWGFDQLMKAVLSDQDTAESVSTPQKVPHSDFRTPEYSGFDTIQDTFWQQDRGIGGSFGYNHTETDTDYATAEELIGELVSAAANNGAFMLNAGPSGGQGTIVPQQLSRLTAIGSWLKANGEAITGTRPWRQSTAATAEGLKVAFTRNGNTLYVTVLGRPAGPITIKGVAISGSAVQLGSGNQVQLTTLSGDTTISGSLGEGFAPVLRISGGA